MHSGTGDGPRQLAADLAALGVSPGSVFIVHSSLSSLGYVTGGAHTVVLALLDVLGPEGTLVVPTHSGDLSDPGQGQNPPCPRPGGRPSGSTCPPTTPC